MRQIFSLYYTAEVEKCKGGNRKNAEKDASAAQGDSPGGSAACKVRLHLAPENRANCLPSPAPLTLKNQYFPYSDIVIASLPWYIIRP